MKDLSCEHAQRVGNVLAYYMKYFRAVFIAYSPACSISARLNSTAAEQWHGYTWHVMGYHLSLMDSIHRSHAVARGQEMRAVELPCIPIAKKASAANSTSSKTPGTFAPELNKGWRFQSQARGSDEHANRCSKSAFISAIPNENQTAHTNTAEASYINNLGKTQGHLSWNLVTSKNFSTVMGKVTHNCESCDHPYWTYGEKATNKNIRYNLTGRKVCKT